MRKFLFALLIVLIFRGAASAQTLLWFSTYYGTGKISAQKTIVGHVPDDTLSSADATYFEVPMPAGTLTALACVTNQPGAGNSFTFTIQDNGSNTSAACTTTHPATTCTWSGSVAVAKNDYLNIAPTTSGGGNTPMNCLASFTATAIPVSAGLNNYSVERETDTRVVDAR